VRGKVIGVFRCAKNFTLDDAEFKIYVGNYIDEEPIEMDIYRKGGLSFKFKNTYFRAYYNTNKQYLVIRRDDKLKNKFAISPSWRDSRPVHK
jgi:hypothetical protein